MSAWQFKIKILPASGLIAHHGEIPKHVKVVRYTNLVAIEELERQSDKLPNYWENFAEVEALESAMADLLPERASWSSLAKMFGEKGKDEIEIWRSDEGTLSRITVSFCLTEPDPAFIRGVLNCADRFECKLVAMQTQNVFEPSTACFVSQAGQCTAARFIPAGRELAEVLRL